MKKFAFNPLTRRKLQRFRSLRRGYWSFLLLLAGFALSLFAELLVNKRALIVRYEGTYHFPTYGAQIPGDRFGLSYEYETNYRELKELFRKENSNNWVLLPLVPYDPYEMDYREETATEIGRAHV